MLITVTKVRKIVQARNNGLERKLSIGIKWLAWSASKNCIIGSITIMEITLKMLEENNLLPETNN